MLQLTNERGRQRQTHTTRHVVSVAVCVADQVFPCEYRREGPLRFVIVALGDHDCRSAASGATLQDAAEAAYAAIPEGSRLVALKASSGAPACRWPYFHLIKGMH